MATINGIDSNIPIELSKGGTNATTLATTNGVIYYDGTRLVTTGAGTANQVLISNGGGSAPSYTSVGGSWQLIATNSPSAATTSVFTTGITYTNYMFVWRNLVGTTVLIQISNDGGGTYKTSSYLSGSNAIPYNGTGLTNATSTAGFNCINCTSTEPSSGIAYVFNCGASVLPSMSAHSYTRTATSGQCFAAGYYTSSITVNAFRLTASAGTLTGTISLYGLSNS